MSHSPEAVANKFLQISESFGKQLTPMKIQKLIYYAHGWHLSLTGEPLINEEVQAWQYGPVISSIYREFKSFGNGPITSPATKFELGKFATIAPKLPNDPDLEQFMQKIWEIYGKFSGIQLSNMTHEEGTPWKEVWKLDSPPNLPIPNDIIKKHFDSLRNAANAGG